jgi:hypothetical protein
MAGPARTEPLPHSTTVVLAVVGRDNTLHVALSANLLSFVRAMSGLAVARLGAVATVRRCIYL